MINFSCVLKFIDSINWNELLRLTEDQIDSIANLVGDGEFGGTAFVKEHINHLRTKYSYIKGELEQYEDIDYKLQKFKEDISRLQLKYQDLIQRVK